MNSRCRALLLAVAVLFLLAASAAAVVPPIPQTPSNYVVDLAGIVDDSAENALNGYLRELEQKTTAQVVVLTVRSLEGASIEEVSLTTAHDRWKLGRKDRDNGLLFVVALEDRKYRIEVGYGLEGVLPDSLVGTIGRQYLVPYFRKGDYSAGISAATLAAINEIASAEGVEITGMPKPVRDMYPGKSGKDGGLLGKIITLLLFIGAVILFITNPRLLLLLLFSSSMGGGRRGWGGGGGGFGGGGFGGGGGGGFGGGGASGSW